MFIEVRKAKKQYGTGEAAVYALNGADLSLEKGDICVILGPSGSGKQTRQPSSEGIILFPGSIF